MALLAVLLVGLGAATDELCGGRVVRAGTQLQLEDTGERFITFGTSSWDAIRSVKNDDGKFERDMDEAKRIGMTSVRIIASGEGYNYGIPSLQPKPRVYDETNFRHLDKAIAIANSRDIRVVLSLANYWNSTGGVDQYLMWARDVFNQTDIPSNIREPDRIHFFNNSITQSLYQDYVSFVMNRTNTITGRPYNVDKGILLFDLMNEPRGEGDPSEDVVHNWVQRQAQHIKSLNDYNLLTTGFEGFFGSSTPYYKREVQPPLSRNGTDPLRTHKICEIDVYCYHMWTPQWFRDDVPWKPDRLQWSTRWMDAHFDIATRIGKPAVLEEYGARENTATPRLDYFNVIFNRTEKAAANQIGAGDIVWLLGGDSSNYGTILLFAIIMVF